MDRRGVVASRVTLALVAALAGRALADDVSPRVPVTRASARAVRTLQAHRASSIDPGLPDISFERFVADSVGAGPQVSWKAGTCNIVLPRVLAESDLCVEVRTESAQAGRGWSAFVDVGTFAGLEPPRLDTGTYWHDTPEGREEVWLSDLGQLAVLGQPAPGDDPLLADSGSLRHSRAQLALIDRVQALEAASLEAGLPAVPLATWAREASGSDVRLAWRVSDSDLKEEEDVCVTLEARRGEGAWGKVHVRTGTDKAPWSGEPVVLPNGLGVCGRDSAGLGTLRDLAGLFRRPGWQRCGLMG
jgi:hypothetical protein